jgi:hypothetical protein
MAITDDLKRAARTGQERATAAWAGLRGQPPATTATPPAASTTPAPVAPGSTTYTRPGLTTSYGAAVGPQVPPSVPSGVSLETPQQAQARLAGMPSTPAVPGGAPGLMGRANAALAPTASRIGGGVGAALEGASTIRDVATPGMTGIDRAARVGEGVGRTAGTIAGGALGATAGSAVPGVGTVIGGLAGGALGYFAPDLVNAASNKVFGTNTQLASDKAASLRAGAPAVLPRDPANPSPNAMPSVQTPAGAAAVATGNPSPAADPTPVARPRFEAYAAGTEGARGIRRQIDSNYVPGSGEGLISSSSGGAVRINPEQSGGGAAPAPMSDRDVVVAGLRDRALNGRNGRARREAAQALGAFLNNEAGVNAQSAAAGAARSTADAAQARQNAELGDKRVKDFNEQFVNNQFYATNDKGVQVPDEARNAQFLDFARRRDPRWATAEGVAQINDLPPQTRSKLVADMRAAFVEKGVVEGAANERALFTRPGLSNTAVQIQGAPRESTLDDIPSIGLGGYVRSNLPFTDRNVVDTDRGAVLASDYVAEDTEGSLDRRRKLYGNK